MIPYPLIPYLTKLMNSGFAFQEDEGNSLPHCSSFSIKSSSQIIFKLVFMAAAF